MLVNKVFQNTVVVMDHRVGALAAIEVVLEAFGHREHILGAVGFDDVLPLAIGADDGDGDIAVARDAVDSREVFGKVVFVEPSGKFHFGDPHGFPFRKLFSFNALRTT